MTGAQAVAVVRRRRRHVLVAVAAALASVLLSGCGSDWEPEDTGRLEDRMSAIPGVAEADVGKSTPLPFYEEITITVHLDRGASGADVEEPVVEAFWRSRMPMDTLSLAMVASDAAPTEPSVPRTSYSTNDLGRFETRWGPRPVGNSYLTGKRVPDPKKDAAARRLRIAASGTGIAVLVFIGGAAAWIVRRDRRARLERSRGLRA
jgi:hypothetical protein